MTDVTWDPERYLTYAGERGRPFVDLIGRIGATGPTRVVDLGCGPGYLTALLADRWPDAEVVGVDSSAEMIAAADARDDRRVTFRVGDIRAWADSGDADGRPEVDVLVSNAALQWVPGHLDLLPGLVATAAPGGWFAFQVPGNFDEPSHVLLRELAAAPAYAEFTAGVERPDAHDAATYLDTLSGLGCSVDAWETTYLHVLQGADPVFTWISGTGARPILQALPEPLRTQFTEQFKTRLREAYPERDHGVVLPFRRIFVVARTKETTR